MVKKYKHVCGETEWRTNSPIYIKSQVEYDEIKEQVLKTGLNTYRARDTTSGKEELDFICRDPVDGTALFDGWTDRPVIVIDDNGDYFNDDDNDEYSIAD
jgi:hypothetical protein